MKKLSKSQTTKKRISWHNGLKGLIEGLIYLTLFIPIIIPTGLTYPHTFGKQTIFYGIIELLFGLYLILCLINKKYWPRFKYLTRKRWQWDWINICVTLFIILLSVSTIFSENIALSFWGTIAWTNGLLLIWHLYILFIVARSVFDFSSKVWPNILKMNLLVSLGLVIYGLYMKYTGNLSEGRAVATFGNPVYFASYLIVPIFTNLALYYSKTKNLWRRAGLLGAIICAYALIVGTKTQGAMIGLGIGAVAMLIVYLLSVKGKKNRRNMKRILLIVLVVVIGLGIYSVASGKLKSFVDSSKSTKNRVIAWSSAWEGFKDRPWFGWGLENFIMPFEQHFNPEFYQQNVSVTSTEYIVEMVHDKPLEVAVLNGVFSFISYLSIFGITGYILYRAYRKTHSPILLVAFGGLAAYFGQDLFAFDSVSSNIQFYILLAYVGYLVAQNIDYIKPVTEKIKINKIVFAMGSVIALLIMATTITYLTVRPAMASVKGVDAISNISAKQLGSGGSLLDAMEKYNLPNVTNKVYEELASQTIQKYYGQKEYSQDERDYFDRLITKMEASVENQPYVLGNYVYLGQLYLIKGNYDSSYYDKSLDIVTKAVDKGSKRIETYQVMAYAYIGKGMPAEAFNSMQKAIDLNPDYGYSYALMARLLVDNGKEEESTVFYVQAFKLGYYNLTDLTTYARLNIEHGNYDNAINAYQYLIQLSPDEPQYYRYLAATYKAKGDIDNAKKTVEVFIERFPQYKDDAEKNFLDTLEQ